MKNEKRPSLRKEIEIPEGVKTGIEDHILIMKKVNKDSDKSEGDVELKRELNTLIDVKIGGDKIILEAKKAGKKENKILGTFTAHIKNMVKGLQEGFKYKLQAVSVHFPMTVSVDKEKNELVIKNFLGENTERRIKLIKGVNVKVDKNIIEIESADKELAGQCAANIEKGSRIRHRDRRIYQDGIYITEKPGRVLL